MATIDGDVSVVLTAALQAARVLPHLSLELLKIVWINVRRLFKEAILLALALISLVSFLSILMLSKMDISLSNCESSSHCDPLTVNTCLSMSLIMSANKSFIWSRSVSLSSSLIDGIVVESSCCVSLVPVSSKRLGPASSLCPDIVGSIESAIDNEVVVAILKFQERSTFHVFFASELLAFVYILSERGGAAIANLRAHLSN